MRSKQRKTNMQARILFRQIKNVRIVLTKRIKLT